MASFLLLYKKTFDAHQSSERTSYGLDARHVTPILPPSPTHANNAGMNELLNLRANTRILEMFL